MCDDECTWHHKTFLMQSVYWHLEIKLYYYYIKKKKKKKIEAKHLIVECYQIPNLPDCTFGRMTGIFYVPLR